MSCAFGGRCLQPKAVVGRQDNGVCQSRFAVSGETRIWKTLSEHDSQDEAVSVRLVQYDIMANGQELTINV